MSSHRKATGAINDKTKVIVRLSQPCRMAAYGGSTTAPAASARQDCRGGPPHTRAGAHARGTATRARQRLDCDAIWGRAAMVRSAEGGECSAPQGPTVHDCLERQVLQPFNADVL